MIQLEIVTKHGTPRLIDNVQADTAAPTSTDQPKLRPRNKVTYSSSILGWKILFMKPIDGDL